MKSPMIATTPASWHYNFKATFTKYDDVLNEFVAELIDGTEIHIDVYVGCATRRNPEQLLGKTWSIKDAWKHGSGAWLTSNKLRLSHE